PADLALIDINLAGEMDGLEVGKWLKRFRDIPIIFVTAHYEDEAYFERAKELAAYAFVKKPIDETELSRTIALAVEYQAEQAAKTDPNQAVTRPQTLLIKVKTKYIRINQLNISCIEAKDKHCAIHLTNGMAYLERITLKEL